jgi:nucleoside-diphosphate-sugar epimerase
MNILVTGGAGYLGSVLLPKLLARGHSVRVLDVGYFGVGHLRAVQPRIHLVREDVRRLITDPGFGRELLDGCDCVIHLAAISNDPSAELNAELTQEVNCQATEALATLARATRVKFVFSSSCSVYGQASGDLDEDGPVSPLTTYAVSKVAGERALLDLSDASWSPIILRNGTLFGYSPRMRFDLVANIFALYCIVYNEIKVFGDGQQWRPFLHVNDCARAFVYFAELQTHEHTCYNIAHANLRVVDLVEVFTRLNPRLRVEHLELPEQDERDYRVSTRRMRDEGFATRVDVEAGAEEMLDAIVGGLIPDPESIFYRNAKWLRELTGIGGKNHRDIVHFMESLADMRQAART